MENEKMNEGVLDNISGGTAKQTQELKEAILANPVLRPFYDRLRASGKDEERAIRFTIQDGMGYRFVPSLNDYRGNNYWEDQFHTIPHERMLEEIKNYNGQY